MPDLTLSFWCRNDEHERCECVVICRHRRRRQCRCECHRVEWIQPELPQFARSSVIRSVTPGYANQRNDVASDM